MIALQIKALIFYKMLLNCIRIEKRVLKSIKCPRTAAKPLFVDKDWIWLQVNMLYIAMLMIGLI